MVGPTASGKTALSIRLAHVLDGEIINGDSMQVYRGLDIGTAKITEEEKQEIPHHLFDIKNPDEPFSVAEFQQLVRFKIEEIKGRGKLPIIVGGTGLYIQSVLHDFRFTEEASDENIRKKYEDLAKEIGLDALHALLKEKDPLSAAQIHPNNQRRVIRALEIAEITGKGKSDIEDGKGEIALYNYLMVGLTMDREKLYERIDQRVDLMMKKGLLREVEGLYLSNLKDVQSIKAIGYKEIYDFLDGKVSKVEAVENIKRNSRNYAKRQLTYFRNKLNVHWFDSLEDQENNLRKILNLVQEFERMN
ncbi:tRNA (adenosine(37)-N6)-dimethylallyltransferase MiaA [Chungangia koreensis]|uniref:tRNA dimethylallyltransferase n=1 Tax=Chungangia koreensis TaxID=752657 RepID=A0ABV8X1D2_9LACT